MITAFLLNKESTTSAENPEYLEEQVATMTAEQFCSSGHAQTEIPAVQGIRAGLDQVAQLAQSFKQAAQAIIKQAFVVGQTILQTKRDFNSTEYQIFLSQIGWTATKANKYLKLVKTFEGFSLEQIGCISLDTLFTLCGSRYQQLVAKLHAIPSCTQELVERLMKECRLPKEPKQQNPISGWKQNQSGGGRHYCVLLHDEVTGIKIEELATWQRLLPQRVIAMAIAAWHELQLPLQTAQAHQFPFSNWASVAEFVGRNRNQLLSLAKSWTPEGRTFVVDLFSAHLKNCPDALNIEIQWVPKNLLEKALSTLSFTVQKIGGSNNLLDEPEIEYVRGCRLVSLKYPNTKHEQWIFADERNIYYVLSRDKFAIERC